MIYKIIKIIFIKNFIIIIKNKILFSFNKKILLIIKQL